MTEFSSATNILTAAASRRWSGSLFRRFFWRYIQAERRETYFSGNEPKSIVVEHDTWSKIFGCFPLGKPPIEMRIQRIRSQRNKTVSVYVIGEPLREVPTFETTDDLPQVFLDLKSAKKCATKLVKEIRQCDVERQKGLANDVVDAWKGRNRPPRKGWEVYAR